MNNITDIEVYKKDAGKIRGNGTFIVSGMFRISFNIVEGSKGLFVSLPQEKYTDKATGATKYAPKVSIPDKNTYEEFQKVILAAFQNAGARQRKSKQAEETTPPPADPADVDADGLPFSDILNLQ